MRCGADGDGAVTENAETSNPLLFYYFETRHNGQCHVSKIQCRVLPPQSLQVATPANVHANSTFKVTLLVPVLFPPALGKRAGEGDVDLRRTHITTRALPLPSPAVTVTPAQGKA